MSSTGALTRCEPCRLRFVASSRGFTDAQDEAQPLRCEDLESGRHASAGRTDLTQFQGCATSLQGRSQAFDDGTFRVVLSVFAPLTGVLLTLSRSEEHTSELQSLRHLVCRLLLETKNSIRTATSS